jgi:hypothetical protein
MGKLIFFFLITLLWNTSNADLTLLNKYSHKTRFNLEQMVYKADCILIVKKEKVFTSTSTVVFDKKTKCPPYNSVYYHFSVQEVIKGKSTLLNEQKIKVKEPFSDLAYTIHYSYYTRGFVIEPFVGEYYPEKTIDSMDALIVFLNSFSSKDSSEEFFQFSVINAYENVAKKDTILKIINRPPADMKRLFLKRKDRL